MKAKLTNQVIQSLAPGAGRYDVRDAELKGFLLRVAPSGEMTYYCDYRRPDGRRTKVRLGPTSVLTPQQARDEAKKILGDRAKGQDPAATRKIAKQETLEAFIEKHYRAWAEAHRKTGKQIADCTLARFAEFRTSRLSDISNWKVEQWRSARRKAGIKASTVNRNVTMLKATLQRAVEWGIIEQNPLVKVKPLKVDSAARIRYLEHDEDAALRAALGTREQQLRDERRRYNLWLAQRHLPAYPDLDQMPFADYLKPMVILSLNTGMRRGEVFNLRWKDVNFITRMLTVEGATSKSGKTRHIPLNQEALETLQSWKSQAIPANPDALVFTSPKGGRFDNVSKSWRAVLKLSGVTSFRWHDMRHDFASKLVMNGVDLYRVCELLGHSDMKITRRYAHLAPQAMADAVATLDRARQGATVTPLKPATPAAAGAMPN